MSWSCLYWREYLSVSHCKISELTKNKKKKHKKILQTTSSFVSATAALPPSLEKGHSSVRCQAWATADTHCTPPHILRSLQFTTLCFRRASCQVSRTQSKAEAGAWMVLQVQVLWVCIMGQGQGLSSTCESATALDPRWSSWVHLAEANCMRKTTLCAEDSSSYASPSGWEKKPWALAGRPWVTCSPSDGSLCPSGAASLPAMPSFTFFTPGEQACVPGGKAAENCPRTMRRSQSGSLHSKALSRGAAVGPRTLHLPVTLS